MTRKLKIILAAVITSIVVTCIACAMLFNKPNQITKVNIPTTNNKTSNKEEKTNENDLLAEEEKEKASISDDTNVNKVSVSNISSSPNTNSVEKTDNTVSQSSTASTDNTKADKIPSSSTNNKPTTSVPVDKPSKTESPQNNNDSKTQGSSTTKNPIPSPSVQVGQVVTSEETGIHRVYEGTTTAPDGSIVDSWTQIPDENYQKPATSIEVTLDNGQKTTQAVVDAGLDIPEELGEGHVFDGYIDLTDQTVIDQLLGLGVDLGSLQ